MAEDKKKKDATRSLGLLSGMGIGGAALTVATDKIREATGQADEDDKKKSKSLLETLRGLAKPRK